MVTQRCYRPLRALLGGLSLAVLASDCTGSGPTDIGAAGGSIGAGGLTGAGGVAVGSGGRAGATGTADGSACATATYDQLILCDRPVGYWSVGNGSGTEPDLSGNSNAGTYKGGVATLSTLPNGDPVTVFNGSSQYLAVPSRASYSIATTHSLTWEGWIRPDVLQFPNDSGSGYVDWMGKCQDYAPTCEWEARMYSTTNSESRCNRMSAYVFNSGAGLGSAADWQPSCGLIEAGTWYHVVGEYTTLGQPLDCNNASTYPGSIDIWVNGVQWNHASHGQTGCMSQYSVVPQALSSPLNIGTMAMDGWFPGAIGKVVVYDYLLSAAQITAHYRAMTSKQPIGTCASTCSF